MIIDISEVFKSKREQLGYSIREVARRTGISKSQLARIENKEHFPRLDTLENLCRFYDLPLYDNILDEPELTEEEEQLKKELLEKRDLKEVLQKNEYVYDGKKLTETEAEELLRFADFILSKR